MANEEQIKILRQSIEIWNKYRQEEQYQRLKEGYKNRDKKSDEEHLMFLRLGAAS
ncbi:hypothetical protein [Ktedonospora formicarum]|uniref:Uncharacterized protein n=1 Tax=Ktedonospora formicarum TaxID=2778364 RepID=A0A8J3I7D8_9CHLR|nr:hypothetical protein [Ktedonospora formicarum]GHO48473.1 hypothetical protein KSX_66360 [Ktedonospora formicarum]